jgi:hypothetical protein
MIRPLKSSTKSYPKVYIDLIIIKELRDSLKVFRQIANFKNLSRTE